MIPRQFWRWFSALLRRKTAEDRNASEANNPLWRDTAIAHILIKVKFFAPDETINVIDHTNIDERYIRSLQAGTQVRNLFMGSDAKAFTISSSRVCTSILSKYGR